MTAPRRRKPPRKSVTLRVRMAEPHDQEIREAAHAAGITVSAWVTERLLRAAREEVARRPIRERHL